jgi:hypothetical protein
MTKTKSTQKIKTASTLEAVLEIIDQHDRFKNSYFWSGNNKSKSLNWETKFNFKFMGNKFEINQSCSSSSKNVYYRLLVYVNGVRKDIRSLKAIV